MRGWRMVATVVMMAALMLEPANAQQLIQPRYICDQGMAVACFAGLDAALGNIVSQGKSGARTCAQVRNSFYNLFFCVKFSYCHAWLLDACPYFVSAINYNLNQTIDWTTNPTCELPQSCADLWGYPINPDGGGFILDSAAPSSSSSSLLALCSLALLFVVVVVA